MSKYFERQLEELHVQLITLGSYCEKAISLSAKAISAVQNEEMARQVFDTDRDIDAKEREIENLCMSLLLQTFLYTLQKMPLLFLKPLQKWQRIRLPW